MNKRLKKWLRKNYTKIVTSIAFYPAIIAIGFLFLSWAMLEIDLTETGKSIKASLSWVRLKDASTARSVVSSIVAGVISLTVFSFSMVMILLNQAASQMSNRMLDSMIGNRFQQITLGFYIGSIVYALFLLTSIRDIDSGIYVPALSIYLLVLLTIVDIFLFIYFLHYVTQSVKYETVIKKIYRKTLKNLQQTFSLKQPSDTAIDFAGQMQPIDMRESNYFQGCEIKSVVKFAQKYQGTIRFLHREGSYVLQGVPLLIFYSHNKLSNRNIAELLDNIDTYGGQPIDKNYYYGYHQLAEVALRALSPGINDPQTAVISLNALSSLLQYTLYNFVPLIYQDDEGVARVQISSWNFIQLFEECIFPIWDYGKNDRYIQHAMLQMIEQIKHSPLDSEQLKVSNTMLKKVKSEIEKKQNE